jgi:hypothetical protein
MSPETDQPHVPKAGGENLLLHINGNERCNIPVPHGFWNMERAGLRDFIKMMWPGVTWASNGHCGMWAINLHFDEATKRV